MIIAVLIINTSYGEDINNKDISENKTGGAASDRLLFLPEVAVLLDGGKYFSNDFNYSAVSHRALTFDILRYNNFVMATYINEETRYRDSFGVKYDPWIAHYDMDFFSLRYEFKYGSLSYFLDHLCSNKINEGDIGLRELRWYGTGIRFESNGIRPGHKDNGIAFKRSDAFSFLNNFNCMLSVVYCLSNGYNKRFIYDLFVIGLLRYDIVRLYNFVPYIEGSFRAITDEDYSRVRYDRAIEGGIRINYHNIDITPYFAYAYKNDVEIYNDPGMDYYVAGLRVESVLCDYYNPENSGKDSHPVLPEIHFLGQYAKYIVNKYMNVNHKFNIDIDLLKFDNFSVFVNNSLRHDSAGQGGLFPRFMEVYAEGGIAYRFNGADILVEPNYRYDRLDDGNQFRGYRQRSETAGLRLRNLKMRTGYVNDGISFKDHGFEWLNKFGWQISGNKIIRDRYYPYDWDLSVKGQWDIFRKNLFIPYLAVQTRYLRGDESVWEYSAVTGARVYDSPQVEFFHEYVYRTESDPDNGLVRHQSMFGLCIEL